MKSKLTFAIFLIALILSIPIFGAWVDISEQEVYAINTVNWDNLVDMWRESDNWVFVQQYRIVVPTQNREWIETAITERNGNVISRTQFEKWSKILSVNAYNSDGYYLSYFGRTKGDDWDWSCSEPNPSRHVGTVQDYFENDFYLGAFREVFEMNVLSLWEQKDIYFFDGVVDVTEIIKNNGVELVDSVPQILRYYNCILTFGTSEVSEPSLKA